MLLTPRWIGRLVVLVLVLAACWWLGSWQWDVAHTTVVRTPPEGTASLVQVHSVGEPVASDEAGRRVSVRGTFDPERQVLVVDRSVDGRPGSWVVTALVVEGAPDAAAAIPVVRGWLPDGETTPRPPSGPQRIEGTLEPTEPDTLRDPERILSAGEVELVSSAELLSLWRPPLFQGFVIQDQPPPEPPLVAVPPPSDVETSTDWQNFAYAIQWWLFGAFAVFWFVRMVRVDLEDASVGKMTASADDQQSSREGSA